MRYTIDFETRSRSELKKTGAYKYARDASTEALCLAFKEDDKRTFVFHFLLTNPPASTIAFDRFREHVAAGGLVCCHNAEFEYNIWNYCAALKRFALPPLRIEQLRCSLARASMVGLPRSLEQLAVAMGSRIQKDLVGYRLMLKMCKPDKKTNTFHSSPDELVRLGEYCIRDVETEYACECLLPELPEDEQKLWELTTRINERGFLIDTESCYRAIDVLEQCVAESNAELSRLTGGRVKTSRQVKKLIAELKGEGVEIDSLKKNAVRDILARSGLSNTAEALLLVRQEAGRSSVSKYQAFINMACDDGRVRGTLMYHGAGTGRYTGKGVQPQNFPRGTIKDALEIVDVLAMGKEALSWMYPSLMEALASALRAMIICPDDRLLLDGDYSAIEARVLVWLAGDATLDAYHAGVDTYRLMAQKIYSCALAEVDDAKRYLGKKVELGCGYGLGHKRFCESCKEEGLDIKPELAKLAVDTYRSTHPRVVEFWKEIERAAVSATRNSGTVVECGRLKFLRHGRYLLMRLPSGRKIYYVSPAIVQADTPVGPKAVLEYLGQKNGKPIREKTYGGKLTENAVQAIARDIMVAAMLRLDAAGYDILLTVHDEILVEATPAQTLAEFTRLMQVVPDWAAGIPLKVGAWSGSEYRKG